MGAYFVLPVSSAIQEDILFHKIECSNYITNNQLNNDVINTSKLRVLSNTLTYFRAALVTKKKVVQHCRLERHRNPEKEAD
jgi:hypothetical protein